MKGVVLAKKPRTRANKAAWDTVDMLGHACEYYGLDDLTDKSQLDEVQENQRKAILEALRRKLHDGDYGNLTLPKREAQFFVETNMRDYFIKQLDDSSQGAFTALKEKIRSSKEYDKSDEAQENMLIASEEAQQEFAGLGGDEIPRNLMLEELSILRADMKKQHDELKSMLNAIVYLLSGEKLRFDSFTYSEDSRELEELRDFSISDLDDEQAARKFLIDERMKYADSYLESNGRKTDQLK